MRFGIVGHLLIDAETGEVTVADGQTSKDLPARAEALYERAHFEQELDYSCLAACTRMVLAFFGAEHDEAELRASLKTRQPENQ